MCEMIALELAGVLSEAEAVTMTVATTRALRMHRMTETLISSRKIAVEKNTAQGLRPVAETSRCDVSPRRPHRAIL